VVKGITMAKSMGKKGTICGPNNYLHLQFRRGLKPLRLWGPHYPWAYPWTYSYWFIPGPLLVLPFSKAHSYSWLWVLIDILFDACWLSIASTHSVRRKDIFVDLVTLLLLAIWAFPPSKMCILNGISYFVH